MSHFFTTGSEVRDYNKVIMVLFSFFGVGQHCGVKHANVSMKKQGAVFGVLHRMVRAYVGFCFRERSKIELNKHT